MYGQPQHNMGKHSAIDYDYFYLATSVYYNNNNSITITEILYCPASIARLRYSKQNGWVLGTSGGGVKYTHNRRHRHRYIYI